MKKPELPEVDTEMEVNLNGVPKKLKDFTADDWLILDCQNYNSEEGDLNLTDGIDCPKCKNKGYVQYADLETHKTYVKKCECMKQRTIYSRIVKCGITRDTLEKCAFKNFQVNSEWQGLLLNKVKDYTKEVIAGSKNWLCVGGCSGAGKTMLCIATFRNLLAKNFDCEFMLWNEEVPKILAMERSSLEENQMKYGQKIKHLQEVEVLYIDDFLKLTSSKYNSNDISLAYKIINSRYVNNRITILSTEYSKGQIEEMDVAIWGRINEKTDYGKYWVTIKNDPNRNFRNNKNEEI